MAENNKKTIFQNLSSALFYGFDKNVETQQKTIHSYTINNDAPIFKTNDKDEYDSKKAQLRQEKYLANQWVSAGNNLSQTTALVSNNLKLMYRDADIMDGYPEIGAALDLYAEETCCQGPKGQLLNITSKSDRVKKVLDDLFVNRLDIHINLPMWTRTMCKYGNAFTMLNISDKNGIIGARQLPVYEIERVENGIYNPYLAVPTDYNKNKDTEFVWVGQNVGMPFKSWQIAHFRLLNDSIFLPYGCLAGDTRIETEFGNKELETINIGDKVWTFDINKQEKILGTVIKYMPKGIQQTYDVKTKHNYINGTEDHKLLTYDNEKLVYKEIKDLKNGDLLIIDNNDKRPFKQIKINKDDLLPSDANFEKSIQWWTKNINYMPDFVDEKFARFFGFMIGDGWISHEKDVCFATGEYQKFNKEFYDYMYKITNRKPRFIKPSNNENNNYEFSEVVCSSKMLSIIMKRMGFNGTFATKRIPKWVFETSYEIKKSFLDGLMIADGSFNIDKFDCLRCGIEMSNEQLIKDIKNLVQSLGLKSGNICSRDRHCVTTLKNGQQIKSTCPSYYFYYYESKNIQEKKYDLNNRINSGFKTEKITSIIKSDCKPVYDITIDNNNENFYANGIVTHNCSVLHKARRHFRILSMMEDMMLIYRLERSIERRVFKIFVGNIDDADIPAYVQDIANTFKRTPIVDPETGQLDLRKNMMPVWKKTPIPLLDGRTISIEDLSREYNEGKINYVYSIQDKTNKIVPGKVEWCGKNYTSEKMVKIWLDDNSYMCMAQEHPIIMRDGTKKRADEVKVGESVMPLYTKCDKKSKNLFDRYEKTYNPNSGKYEPTHRLIASEINKEDEKYNTVHHSDFNKYNNSPNNLVWMDYKEHHKMHGEISKKNWENPEIRKRISKKLSEKAKLRYIDGFPKDIALKISKKLKEEYASGKLDWIKAKNCKNFDEYRKTKRFIEEVTERGIRKGYREEFKNYNNSNLHKTHNNIRKESTKNSWIGEGRSNRMAKMSISFDNFIWDELRTNIIKNNIFNRKTMLEYVNNNLIEHLISINNNKRLNNNRFISREVLERRIVENGFNTITEYIKSQKLNHKISKIEYIGGDDVYCMTVSGLNKEDDRHNFAIKTFNINGNINNSGCFVGNSVDQDIFIPVKDVNASNPIETLPAASNLDKIEDLKYIQNKVLTALRIPKEFLNFEEAAGDGKNLAIKDIRFTRTINRIQQALIMELTKIAVIHLYLNGFTDELTNFKITMNSPSTQAEILRLEELSKKIALVTSAVQDPGNGIQIMSLTRAQREILEWSDAEITQNILEIRMEKALAAELLKTEQIIKRTGVFDEIDKIYGEPDAEYIASAMEDGSPGGGGGGGLGGFGEPGEESLGEPGSEEPGGEGEMPPPPNENAVGLEAETVEPTNNEGPKLEATQIKVNKLLTENKKVIKNIFKERKDKYLNAYVGYISSHKNTLNEDKEDIVPIINQAFLKNEETNQMINILDKKLKNK